MVNPHLAHGHEGLLEGEIRSSQDLGEVTREETLREVVDEVLVEPRLDTRGITSEEWS